MHFHFACLALKEQDEIDIYMVIYMYLIFGDYESIQIYLLHPDFTTVLAFVLLDFAQGCSTIKMGQ